MAEAPFERKQLVCPKCGSSALIIESIREMFEARKPADMPLYNANVKERVKCADCGNLIWPAKKAEPQPDKVKAKK